jgi:hypothetical protein
MGNFTPSSDSKEKMRVEFTKDHSVKGEEPRGPKIKGSIARRRVLRKAREIWAFLWWKGVILFERKYGQSIGAKVMKEGLRGGVYSRPE